MLLLTLSEIFSVSSDKWWCPTFRHKQHDLCITTMNLKARPVEAQSRNLNCRICQSEMKKSTSPFSYTLPTNRFYTKPMIEQPNSMLRVCRQANHCKRLSRFASKAQLDHLVDFQILFSDIALRSINPEFMILFVKITELWTFSFKMHKTLCNLSWPSTPTPPAIFRIVFDVEYLGPTQENSQSSWVEITIEFSWVEFKCGEYRELVRIQLRGEYKIKDI